MMKVIFKKIFFGVLYFTTVVTACLFALFLVLSFINPAVSQNNQIDSQNNQTDQTKNKPGFKEIMGDIFKNLKTLLKESSDKNKELTEGTQPIDTPPESQDPQDPPPEQAPQDFPPEQAPQDFPPEQAPQDLPPEELASPEDSLTEAQPPMSAPSNFMEGLSGVPSDWILDIQSSIAPFIYEYGTQKDPFDDPTIKEESAGEGVIVIPKTPPEEYDLSEINLKGITWHTETPKALFELPNNAGYYTLIKGDKIGKNGVIFEIREDEVVIVETTIIGRGSDTKEEIKVKIKRLDRLNLSGSSKEK